MNLDDRAFTIAARIADGTAINWPEADASPAGPEDRALLDELKDIAALATLHRRPSDWPSEAGRPADSLWGPLTLIALIGEGRFGRVYRAWDARLQRHVALKLLHAQSSAVTSPMGAIEEARLLARVRHPNVLTVHGAECLDGQVGIWTEFIEGRTLETLLAEREPMPPEEVVAIGIDLCRALGAVHDAGLLHRDVKAQNVMRETGGRIVLMDFGTGHDLDVVPASGGDLSGTPLYLAPEIFAGRRATVASDVYALAVLLFRLLTGQCPVPGQTLDDVRAGHAAGRAVRLRDARPDLPEVLVEAIERGLAQDPSQRFDSAGTFETALRGADVPTVVERPNREDHHRRLWTWMTASAAVFIAAASLAAWRWWHPGGVIALTARDWVLVADFENQTGEPLFEGTVRYGVERELANSSRVRVLPRPRIEDILRLMRKPLDSPVDPELAHEIAIRDGQVRAIVTGRIEHAAAGYVLTASVVSPQAEVLSSVSERASSQAGAAEAVHRLSTDLRGRLGEAKATVDMSDKPPEPVTTPSLKAVQTYTRAVELGDRGQWPAALEMARQAVSEDPEFASAQIWLAYALVNTNHKPEGIDVARAAVARITSVTDWERYWILGSYHYMLGDFDKAAAEFEALLALKPNHLWAVSNLSQITGSTKYAVRLAELRPNDIGPRIRIIHNLAITGAGPADVEPYRLRALALLSAEKQPAGAGQLLMLPAHFHWLKDDPRSATHDIEQALGDWRMRTDHAQQGMKVPAFLLYAAMGQIDAGRRLIAGTRSEYDRDTYLALADFYSGKIAEARDEISGVTTEMLGTPASKWALPIWLMTHTGRLAQAEAALHFAELHGRLGEPYAFMAARGDLVLAQGDVDGAIALLEPAVLNLPTILTAPDFLGTFYRASAALAEARLRKGEAGKAIETLQSALEVRGFNPNVNPGVFLVALRSRLAALYRHVGRRNEADVLDARVAKVLELADPAFLRRLKQLAEKGISDWEPVRQFVNSGYGLDVPGGIAQPRNHDLYVFSFRTLVWARQPCEARVAHVTVR